MDIESIAPTIKKAFPWLMVWSFVVLICGILAIVLSLTFSFAIAVVIGLLVLVAGIAHLVFAFRTTGLGGFLIHILLCVVYEIAAICLLANPLLGVISLSLIVAVFLILEGILEFALYFQLKSFRHAIWVLFDGIGTLILGILIVRHWPPASPEAIGALIGISLILSAISRIIFFLAVHRLTPASAA